MIIRNKSDVKTKVYSHFELKHAFCRHGVKYNSRVVIALILKVTYF